MPHGPEMLGNSRPLSPEENEVLQEWIQIIDHKIEECEGARVYIYDKKPPLRVFDQIKKIYGEVGWNVYERGNPNGELYIVLDVLDE